jgi:hypothetical protein
MRTFVLAALLSSAALAKSEDRSVPSFSSVHVSAGMRATIEIGPQKPVHIEADESVLGLIETVVEDGALNIRFKPHTSWTGDHSVRITIQTPQLHAVSASGGSIVKAAFTRSDTGAVQASGGSEITVRDLDAGSVSVQASGGSIVRLAGSSDDLELQLSGGSQMHGRDFSTRDVDVQGSGGSQAEFKATGKIRGGLSGGSQLHVAGGASTRVATSGGSEVYGD